MAGAPGAYLWHRAGTGHSASLGRHRKHASPATRKFVPGCRRMGNGYEGRGLGVHHRSRSLPYRGRRRWRNELVGRSTSCRNESSALQSKGTHGARKGSKVCTGGREAEVWPWASHSRDSVIFFRTRWRRRSRCASRAEARGELRRRSEGPGPTLARRTGCTRASVRHLSCSAQRRRPSAQGVTLEPA